MADLESLNEHFALYSYIGATPRATMEDYGCHKGINVAALSAKNLLGLQRWYFHVSRLMATYGPFDALGNPLPNDRNSLIDSLQNNATSKPHKQAQQTGSMKKDPVIASSSPTEVTHFCVLDFEKTCEDREKGQLEPQEIIEFPSVLVGRSPFCVLDEFETYVKPRVHPTLTEFCTSLTKITQAKVDSAPGLAEALGKHHSWLRSHVAESDRCIFVTCGDMDLKTSLPQDPNCPEEVPSCYRRWINIKKEFGVWQGWKKGKQAKNMIEMLEKLDIQFDPDKVHSGIDDCRCIAQILETMVAGGWCPT